MEEAITLKAEQRQVLGKKVKRLRREGYIPGVAYGPGMEPLSVQFARKDLIETYRRAGTSTLVGLVLGHQRHARPALIREVQRDPITHEIVHVDIELVDLQRAITTQVPIVLRGQSPVVEQGFAVLTHGLDEITVRCLPTEVPSQFEVDLSALTQPDQAIHVGDLTVPDGIHVVTDAETVIVYATSIRRLEEAEAKAAREVEEVVEEEAATGKEDKES